MDNKHPVAQLGQGGLKAQWRKRLVEERLHLEDRLARNDALQRVMRVWLVDRPDVVIGAYWPIKGEFDPLPALFRWQEAGMEADALGASRRRQIGLPVINKVTKTLTFHTWYPGCPMEEDAYGIPKPKDTETIEPTLLFVPCVGYGPGGYRLGYGGGFYDRTLSELRPRPFTVGLGYTHGFLPDLEPEPHDVPLDAILNDNGVVWPLA
ncbi:5-formyltetrahydrofolate cyclo-ligase [Aquabacterium sp. A08]|uniref:5-formyltetrahydrofolate cyclo-ligase n=1 Tax=Aquabacterium sp. A08 TaxID=2718532 RepID=UPI001422C28E|nr:5-formyltetrahydrofolate cyclo-ligase [Aquabacterium sp. A08]NIC41398.1 5-formyltetrahydrofolate cyclo-ligase [Aquabacterium sp. A08]NIC41445.1 5-formyltetrahydrofolate cyclo-ligase [Aquabacterium sp. A08]